MYLEKFSLNGRPFSNGIDDAFFTPNDDYETAVNRVRHALLARDAIAVITGGPGVGKSSLVARAIGAEKDKIVVAHVDLRQADPNGLYESLLLELGGAIGDGQPVDTFHRLKTEIAEINSRGKQVTAVIDVSGLTIERARRILQLIHLNDEPGGQMNIVLLGPHILHRLLDTPGLIHLRQRVIFRYRVRPLSVPETENYVRAHIEKRGGDAESVLGQGASFTVFRYVGGVPRLINTLMDATLCEAATRDREEVGANLVTEVAGLLGWRPLTQAAGQEKQKQARSSNGQAAVGTVVPRAGSTAATGSPAANTDDDEVSDSAVEQAFAEKSDASSDIDQPYADPEPGTNADSATESATDSTPPLGSGVPAMTAADPGATGMLRLEDLDAHFAETIFGDDADSLVKGDEKKVENAAG